MTEILILLACAVKTADYSRPLDVRESIPEETKTLYIDTSKLKHENLERNSQSTNPLLVEQESN